MELEVRQLDQLRALPDADGLAEGADPSGGYPRRRIAASVGIRGSSQPRMPTFDEPAKRACS